MRWRPRFIICLCNVGNPGRTVGSKLHSEAKKFWIKLDMKAIGCVELVAGKQHK